MSAPVAVSATAGSANLLFTSLILNPSLAVAPVGMWAKASISSPSELAREAGEAQPVGNADRPHIRRRRRSTACSTGRSLAASSASGAHDGAAANNPTAARGQEDTRASKCNYGPSPPIPLL